MSSVPFLRQTVSARGHIVSVVTLAVRAKPLIFKRSDAWHAACNPEGVTTLQSVSPVDWAVRAEAPSAAVYSFVPAGGADCARSESRRAVGQLSEAMRELLADAGDHRTVRLADFLGAEEDPMSSITCMDLADADPAEAREAIRVSEAIFVVSATDPASIEDACAQAAWLQYVLRSLQREEECGLLLVPAPGGITASEAERRTGLPVCGVFRSTDDTAQLARWIVQN
jgi:hypothetical protein